MLRLQLCISKCFPVDKIRLIDRRVFKGIIQYVHPTKYFLFEITSLSILIMKMSDTKNDLLIQIKFHKFPEMNDNP